MSSNTADFPFVHWLELHYAEIRTEAERLSLADFVDWPQTGAYEGGWKAFCLFSRDPGWLLASTCPANARRCPITSAVLSRIHGVVRGGFSLLLPGAHIFLHEDGQEHEDSLRCHLALRTNPRAQMRCGQDVLSWQEGQCLLFDGRTPHESANLGSTPRLVCLVDVDRACLRDGILS